jgi:hypothetical protein
MLTATGRGIRAALVLVVVALTLVGTRRCEDECFPFGPMSMFAYRTAPSGQVNVAELRGRVDGEPAEVKLSMASFGLRRGEVEGQLTRMHHDPSLLGELVRARETVRGDLPRLTELRLVQVYYVLHDGQRTGYREQVVAEWRR